MCVHCACVLRVLCVLCYVCCVCFVLCVLHVLCVLCVLCCVCCVVCVCSCVSLPSLAVRNTIVQMLDVLVLTRAGCCLEQLPEGPRRIKLRGPVFCGCLPGHPGVTHPEAPPSIAEGEGETAEPGGSLADFVQWVHPRCQHVYEGRGG